VRRYRVRAFGIVDQKALAALADGLTIDGVKYKPIKAELEKRQGDNVWLSISLTEGKNREVRKVMEHLGLRVNRLIRTAYGPFQLGALDKNAVEEIPGKQLREQLGKTMAAEIGL
jgi:23S rRNA pseudouridine2605 synthase